MLSLTLIPAGFVQKALALDNRPPDLGDTGVFDGGVPATPTLLAIPVGIQVKGFTVTIDASKSKLMLQTLDCGESIDLNSPTYYSWQIESVSGASSFNPANLQKTNTLTPTLFLEQPGTYKIKFTMCPNGCSVGNRHYGPASEYTYVESLPVVQPATLPALPTSVLNAITEPYDLKNNNHCPVPGPDGDLQSPVNYPDRRELYTNWPSIEINRNLPEG